MDKKQILNIGSWAITIVGAVLGIVGSYIDKTETNNKIEELVKDCVDKKFNEM